ncbi:MAG: aldo/keto reductase, partial [Rhodospirillales bacterium]|nr:aldo/keto reductase [Rhodospirillales bacterium]
NVVIGAVFASGILATGSGNPGIYNYNAPEDDVLDRVRGMEVVCARHGVSLASAALQFPLAHPVVRAVIPGADTPVRVRENIVNIKAEIPADFWQDLKDEKLLRADAPTPASRPFS